MRLLEGKSLVIVGGTSGIGLSASRVLQSEGARLVVVGKGADTCAEARQALADGAEVIEADAVDEATAASAIEVCVSRFGSFDGLYHVAGGSGRAFGDGPLHELTLEGWNKTLELNLTSLMLSNRAAIRAFLGRKSGGAILNLSSVLAFSPSPRHFSTHAYAAAKSAIIGFSKSLAAYYAASGIRVNVLAPALVETPMSKRASADPAIQSYIATRQPLDGGRMGEPADLDGAAIYFLADQSRFVTGQVLSVDGGWSVSEGQL
jgi:NAD(P)-dependent dehydrogenase (short-subunit alcohol dehydrogenase family)